MKIVVDTREQTPWAFPCDLAESVRGTLTEGDYALEGDDGFAIERKSLSDFLGTISTGWERFKRELNRMDAKGFPTKVIIVEGDISSLFFGPNCEPPQHDHPHLTPQFVAKRIAQLTYDRRCSVLFACSAPIAAGLATQIFRRREKEINDDN